MRKTLTAIGPFLPMLLYVGLGIAAIVGIGYLFTYLQKQFGAGAPDPGGGAKSVGVLDGILNQTMELGSSSLNYTGALQQTVADPKGTIDAIVGTSPTADTTSPNATSFGHDATWYATFGIFGK